MTLVPSYLEISLTALPNSIWTRTFVNVRQMPHSFHPRCNSTLPRLSIHLSILLRGPWSMLAWLILTILWNFGWNQVKSSKLRLVPSFIGSGARTTCYAVIVWPLIDGNFLHLRTTWLIAPGSHIQLPCTWVFVFFPFFSFNAHDSFQRRKKNICKCEMNPRHRLDLAKNCWNIWKFMEKIVDN